MDDKNNYTIRAGFEPNTHNIHTGQLATRYLKNDERDYRWHVMLFKRHKNPWTRQVQTHHICHHQLVYQVAEIKLKTWRWPCYSMNYLLAKQIPINAINTILKKCIINSPIKLRNCWQNLRGNKVSTYLQNLLTTVYMF